MAFSLADARPFSPSKRAVGALALAALFASSCCALSSVPGYLAGTLDVLPGSYSVPDMMALRGAVAEEDIPAIHAITGDGRDFDAVVARATSQGHGSLQLSGPTR